MADAIAAPAHTKPSREQGLTVFARTMHYVAATAGLFALGAYAGRDLVGGVGIAAFIAAFAALIGMQYAARRSTGRTIVLLAAFGFLLGLATAPTLGYYAAVDPQALWQAGGATGLFVAGFGAAGYATRRDLTAVARASSALLVGLLVLGLVLVFVSIPGTSVGYSLLGLVVFAGYTLVDFQRLRRATALESPPLLAASIFLDVVNVFLFFIPLFSSDD